MQRQDLRDLVKNESFLNYCFGTSPADMQYWEKWLSENPDQEDHLAELKKAVLLLGRQIGNSEAETQFDKLNARISARVLPQVQSKNRIKIWLMYSAAAAVAIAFGIGFYTFKQKGRLPETVKMHDVKPGINKAVLTLADGTKVSLTDAANGVIARQAGIKILKTADGQLLYDFSGMDDSGGAAKYNTLEVPAGGQWQIVLPDNSKVWLNARSSITYPAKFTGAERRVKIAGEAYFEVSHDRTRPFKVEVRNQVVEVMGTHFNIMAYADEKLVKTTLLQGSVKVTNNGQSQMLAPGQQAQADQNSISLLKNVDTEKAVAWKNGYFMFNDSDLHDVMRQLSRWYDVDVVFKNQRAGHEFVGEISRKYSLVKVLKILELSNIQFELKGRTLIVK